MYRSRTGTLSVKTSQRNHAWQLFWGIALVLSGLMVTRLSQLDLGSVRDTRQIVLWSVRCAIPLFLVAFCASSLAVLWPGRVTRWLVANRRYFGLAFAFGMAWHLSFVGYWLMTFPLHLNRIALSMDLFALMFLVILSLTSFQYFARRLGAGNWRLIHKAGIYSIWLVLTYIYSAGARERDPYYICMFIVLVGAWGLRAAAWSRWRKNRMKSPASYARSQSTD